MAIGTTAKLISAVKLRAGLPANTPQITDDEILGLAYDELLSRILPILQDCKCDHLTVRTTIQLVAGQGRYRLPARALGRKLRSVSYVDTAGNIWPLPQLTVGESDAYQNRAAGTIAGFGVMLEGTSLVVSPAPNQGFAGQLLVRYYVRPAEFQVPAFAFSERVLADPVGTDTTIEVTVDASLAFPAPTTIDVIQGTPAHGFLLVDGVTDGVVTTTVPLTEPWDFALARPGDIVYSFATGCPVVPVPDELYPALVQATVAQVHQVLGRKEAMSLALAMVDRYVTEARSVLMPPIDGGEIVLVNWTSPLRGGRRYIGRW